MRFAIAAGAMLALSGCAMAPSFTGTTKVASHEPIKLDKVYLYSFLDVRANELGPAMMAEIERQLGEGFQARGVTVQQHWYLRSAIAAQTATTGGTSTRVPVGEVIKANEGAETAFGARYRLIAFPAQTTQSGSWYHYDFRWQLTDSKTESQVWETTSQGKHMNWMKQDENSVERARMIVDGVLQEMVNVGLVEGKKISPLDKARAAQLEQLDKLRNAGRISESEYKARREKIEKAAGAEAAAATP